MKILVANSLARKNKPLVALLRSLAGHFDLVVRSSDVFFFSSFPGGKKMNFGPSAGGWQCHGAGRPGLEGPGSIGA